MKFLINFVSAVSAAVVPVLRVVCGETRHPDLAGGGQNNPSQQHTLRHPVQATASQTHSGVGRPGNLSTSPVPPQSGLLKRFEGDDAVIKLHGAVQRVNDINPETSASTCCSGHCSAEMSREVTENNSLLMLAPELLTSFRVAV